MLEHHAQADLAPRPVRRRLAERVARSLLPEPEPVLARGEQPPAVPADVAIAVEDRLVDELVAEVDLPEAVNVAPSALVAVELDQMVGHVEEDGTETVPPSAEISTQALFLILLLSAPMLMSALSIGLVVSLLQATTQIQEQTLGFVPKLMAVFISALICGPWIGGMVGNFASKLFSDIAHLGPHY